MEKAVLLALDQGTERTLQVLDVIDKGSLIAETQVSRDSGLGIEFGQ